MSTKATYKATLAALLAEAGDDVAKRGAVLAVALAHGVISAREAKRLMREGN